MVNFLHKQRKFYTSTLCDCKIEISNLFNGYCNFVRMFSRIDLIGMFSSVFQFYLDSRRISLGKERYNFLNIRIVEYSFFSVQLSFNFLCKF